MSAAGRQLSLVSTPSTPALGRRTTFPIPRFPFPMLLGRRPPRKGFRSMGIDSQPCFFAAPSRFSSARISDDSDLDLKNTARNHRSATRTFNSMKLDAAQYDKLEKHMRLVLGLPCDSPPTPSEPPRSVYYSGPIDEDEDETLIDSATAEALAQASCTDTITRRRRDGHLGLWISNSPLSNPISDSLTKTDLSPKSKTLTTNVLDRPAPRSSSTLTKEALCSLRCRLRRRTPLRNVFLRTTPEPVKLEVQVNVTTEDDRPPSCVLIASTPNRATGSERGLSRSPTPSTTSSEGTTHKSRSESHLSATSSRLSGSDSGSGCARTRTHALEENETWDKVKGRAWAKLQDSLRLARVGGSLRMSNTTTTTTANTKRKEVPLAEELAEQSFRCRGLVDEDEEDDCAPTGAPSPPGRFWFFSLRRRPVVLATPPPSPPH